MKQILKRLRLNGITWRVGDEELAVVLSGIRAGDTGRRGYAITRYKEQNLFIKTFVERGITGLFRNIFAPRGRKEYRMGSHLLHCDIATPQPVGFGRALRNSYIIQEEVGGDNFWSLWKGGKNREGLLRSLAYLLKQLSAHGVRHNDLHLENILVSQGRLYLIDLHSMEIMGAFGINDEVSNLTHALAMIYRDMTVHERVFFFNAYDSDKGLHLMVLVENGIKRMLFRWIEGKKKRALRNTSKARWDGPFLRMTGNSTIPESAFAATLKKDKKVVVERYENHIRKIYRNKRRLIKAWRNHIVLAYMEITLAPASYHLKWPGILGPGYIAMEDLTGRGEELDRALDRLYDTMTNNERKHLADTLARFLNHALSAGILHKDLKGCNVFALHDGTFRLLDVEDIAFSAIDNNRLMRMLVQLNTTIPKRIVARDRIRFFITLCRGLDITKKQVFRDTQRLSLEQDIVYEGIDGLERESW